MFPLFALRRKTEEKEAKRNDPAKGMEEVRVRSPLSSLGTAIVAPLHRLMVLRVPLSVASRRFARRSDAAERTEKAPKGTTRFVDPARRISRPYVSIAAGASSRMPVHDMLTAHILKLKRKFQWRLWMLIIKLFSANFNGDSQWAHFVLSIRECRAQTAFSNCSHG